MPSLYDLKPAFQNTLRPLVRKLANNGITANQVTLSALVLSVAVGIALAFNPMSKPLLLAIPCVMLVRMALNAIDGMLAREHNMQTPLGAVLNELCDVIADAALYLPFALLPNVNAVLIVLLVLAATISEMTGIIGVQIGASRRYDGPLGKSDRAFVFGALALALGLGYSGTGLDWIFGGLFGLSVVTIINRARRALQEIAA